MDGQAVSQYGAGVTGLIDDRYDADPESFTHALRSDTRA
jgi:hypothetical protein